MKVLIVCDYDKNKVVELESFDVDSLCVEVFGEKLEVLEESLKEYEEEYGEIEEGGGDDSENFGDEVFSRVYEDKECNVIVLVEWVFCVENGWFEKFYNCVKEFS
jgi:hypothetical protein